LTLREIESTFRTLKTDLSIRPVFHQKDKNVEAHIFLGVLAYQVVASIRHQLKIKGIRSEWREIERIMNTQKATTTSFVTNEDKKVFFRKCSRPINEALKIYNALGLKSMPFYTTKM
jgi:transposase